MYFLNLFTSFETISQEATFCEDNLALKRLKSQKRRSCPTVKKLNFSLSKIKTTINHKPQRVSFNLNNSFGGSEESLNQLDLQSIQNQQINKKSKFVKNQNLCKQKSSGSVVMVI